MPSKIIELSETLQVRRKALAGIFAEAGPDMDMTQIKSIDGDTKAKAEKINSLNEELSALGKEYDGLREAERIMKENSRELARLTQPVSPLEFPGSTEPMSRRDVQKSLGQQFIESTAFRGAQQEMKSGGGRPRFGASFPDYELKTVMTTAAGFAPPNFRTDIVIPSAQRTPNFAAYLPQDPTDSGVVKFMEETTFTNAVAPAAEGAAKAEAALAFTERTQTVEVLAAFLPVTLQQLEDVSGMRSIIDGRLQLMLAITEEVQLLTGSGTTPALQGFLTKAGILTQAKGADPTPDAIYKAMIQIMATGFANPDLFVVHPLDWQDIRLLRTADGIYIWGSPSESGIDRIWGLPVVKTVSITQNTGFVGDFQSYSHISRRMGVRIDVSDSHSDFFIRNQYAIRVEERLSLEIYRAAAFASVTGI